MPKPRGLSKHQMAAWNEVNSLAISYGSWVVSEPDKNPIRLECMNYDLPLRLASMNYDITSLGTNDRLIPMAGVVAPGTVLVFQVDLPLGPVATGAIP